MEENCKKNKIPFPQANDLEKVVKLIYTSEDNINNNDYLIKFLGVTQRQVNYYLSACVFLDILDKRRKFTLFGESLRKKSEENMLVYLSQKIISKPVFCEAFFYRFFYNQSLKSEEISELISAVYGLDNLEVADRRASTVKKWIEWIFSKKIKMGELC